MATGTVPRISQLDAVEFDNSIKTILSNQLFEIEKYLRPGVIVKFKPELKFLIDTLIFRYSVLNRSGTFGQQLLNLKYPNISKKCAYVYFSLTVLLPYLKERYEDSWRAENKKLRIIIDGLWHFGKLAEFLNLLIFLRGGIFPTFTDRLLGLRYVHATMPNRGVTYNYMMRELLWHNFMEFMKFSLPLVNWKALQRVVRSWAGPRGRGVQVPAPSLDLTTRCVVCSYRPNTPCRVSLFCNHVACYVCIKGNVMADKKYSCPACGEVNTAINEVQFIAK